MVFDCINSRSMTSSLLCIPSFVTTSKLFTKVLKQRFFLELWLTTYMKYCMIFHISIIDVITFKQIRINIAYFKIRGVETPNDLFVEVS